MPTAKSATNILITLSVLCLVLPVLAGNDNLLEIGAIGEWYHADGTISSVGRITNSYDAHGDLAETVVGYYSSTGVLNFAVTTTFTYDKHGNKLFAIQEFSNDPRSRAVITYTNLGSDVSQELKAQQFRKVGYVSAVFSQGQIFAMAEFHNA
jgi:hypothetical protein